MNKENIKEIQEGCRDIYESIKHFDFNTDPIKFNQYLDIFDEDDVKPLRDKLSKLVELLDKKIDMFMIADSNNNKMEYFKNDNAMSVIDMGNYIVKHRVPITYMRLVVINIFAIMDVHGTVSHVIRYLQILIK